MVINNNKNINSINPCKVRLPNSKIFNIKGTDFKYKIHYDQLNDTVVLRIEEQVNYIFNAYKKRYTLPIDADVTFEGYIYNNLEQYFYAYPEHQRTPSGGYIGGHSIGLSQHMPYKDHMQWLLAHEIAHSLNYYNLKNHNIPILKCSHEGHDDATDFGNEVGTEISLLSKARQSEYDRKLSTAVQSEDISEVTDFLNKDDSGKTPFEIALKYQNPEVINLLANAKDKYSKTILHYAAEDNNLNLVRLLVENGANISAKDKNGKTPIGIAIDQRHDSVAVYLQQTQLGLNTQLLVAVLGNDFNKVKDLVSKGASVDTKDNNGWTLLHHTAKRGYLEVAEFLIEKGADINAEDKYGKKPIQRAAEENNTNIITLLLSKGVNIDDTDRNGRTSLYWAAWNGNLDAVKYLVGKDASIQAGDKDGKTALDIARDKGYNDVVNYLEEELNKEREKPVQRRRRRHHGDHVRHHMSRKPLAIDSSNQPEIAVSSSTKPSSRINDCISWVKKLAASTFSIIPRLPAQYKIADKNNVKSDNKNIPQSTSSVGWNKFLNNENIALASCVADALDNTPSRRYQDLMSKGVEVVPSRRVAVEFALENFNSFVEDKIRNLDSKEQARIRVELKGAYPEITASLERGVEFSGNIGLDNVLEKCKKCFCTNVLPKDKVSTCLSEIGVTKLGGNLNR